MKTNEALKLLNGCVLFGSRPWAYLDQMINSINTMLEDNLEIYIQLTNDGRFEFKAKAPKSVVGEK